jgi:predicted N-acetyltransferase YhbS
MENIIIRLEKLEDYSEAENLTREAFWDLYKPGCDEHLVLHKIRNAPAFVGELGFVACDNNKIVGNIIYSKAKIVNSKGEESIVLCMGPFAVLPSYQKKRIGSLLLKQSVKRARELGYKAVIIFGNPDYYHRFGFKNAKEYSIQTSSGENFEPFMALELFENSLSGIQGKFYYDPVFEVKKDELDLFEKGFPFREKHVTDTQLKQ